MAGAGDGPRQRRGTRHDEGCDAGSAGGRRRSIARRRRTANVGNGFASRRTFECELGRKRGRCEYGAAGSAGNRSWCSGAHCAGCNAQLSAPGVRAARAESRRYVERDGFELEHGAAECRVAGSSHRRAVAAHRRRPHEGQRQDRSRRPRCLVAAARVSARERCDRTPARAECHGHAQRCLVRVRAGHPRQHAEVRAADSHRRPVVRTGTTRAGCRRIERCRAADAGGRRMENRFARRQFRVAAYVSRAARRAGSERDTALAPVGRDPGGSNMDDRIQRHSHVESRRARYGAFHRDGSG